MFKHLAILIVFSSATLFAQLQHVPEPGPEAYTIGVHVESSRLITVCGSDPHGSSCGILQELRVLIDGKKYRLTGGFATFEKPRIIHPGPYHARIVDEDSKREYEYTRTYEFRFADGHTRKYEVVGESE